ncbi:hypothetical protein FZEAL_2930 [Fusarium zealandicum]|uniref:Protein kinase domain-containing protein n=1 Tax=Fusarium zealandicum TaxID=1053134 RepID=A0A8H4XN30_9HYPO|nr:hypothetical protein FZEAL_2930 [Fusarium zealandicum]
MMRQRSPQQHHHGLPALLCPTTPKSGLGSLTMPPSRLAFTPERPPLFKMERIASQEQPCAIHPPAMHVAFVWPNVLITYDPSRSICSDLSDVTETQFTNRRNRMAVESALIRGESRVVLHNRSLISQREIWDHIRFYGDDDHEKAIIVDYANEADPQKKAHTVPPFEAKQGLADVQWIGFKLQFIKVLAAGGHGYVALWRVWFEDGSSRKVVIKRGLYNWFKAEDEASFHQRYDGADHTTQIVNLNDQALKIQDDFRRKNPLTPLKYRNGSSFDAEEMNLIVFEFLDYGDMHSILTKAAHKKEQFSAKALWGIWECLVRGIAVCAYGPVFADQGENFEARLNKAMRDGNTEEFYRTMEFLEISHDVHLDLEEHNILAGKISNHPNQPIFKLHDLGAFSWTMNKSWVKVQPGAYWHIRSIVKPHRATPEQIHKDWDDFKTDMTIDEERQLFAGADFTAGSEVAGRFGIWTSIFLIAKSMEAAITSHYWEHPFVPKHYETADGSSSGPTYGWMLNEPKFAAVDADLRDIVCQCMFERPVERPSVITLLRNIEARKTKGFSQTDEQLASFWESLTAPMATALLEPGPVWAAPVKAAPVKTTSTESTSGDAELMATAPLYQPYQPVGPPAIADAVKEAMQDDMLPMMPGPTGGAKPRPGQGRPQAGYPGGWAPNPPRAAPAANQNNYPGQWIAHKVLGGPQPPYPVSSQDGGDTRPFSWARDATREANFPVQERVGQRPQGGPPTSKPHLPAGVQDVAMGDTAPFSRPPGQPQDNPYDRPENRLAGADAMDMGDTAPFSRPPSRPQDNHLPEKASLPGGFVNIPLHRLQNRRSGIHPSQPIAPAAAEDIAMGDTNPFSPTSHRSQVSNPTNLQPGAPASAEDVTMEDLEDTNFFMRLPNQPHVNRPVNLRVPGRIARRAQGGPSNVRPLQRDAQEGNQNNNAHLEQPQWRPRQESPHLEISESSDEESEIEASRRWVGRRPRGAQLDRDGSFSAAFQMRDPADFPQFSQHSNASPLFRDPRDPADFQRLSHHPSASPLPRGEDGQRRSESPPPRRHRMSINRVSMMSDEELSEDESVPSPSRKQPKNVRFSVPSGSAKPNKIAKQASKDKKAGGSKERAKKRALEEYVERALPNMPVAIRNLVIRAQELDARLKHGAIPKIAYMK